MQHEGMCCQLHTFTALHLTVGCSSVDPSAHIVRILPCKADVSQMLLAAGRQARFNVSAVPAQVPAWLTVQLTHRDSLGIDYHLLHLVEQGPLHPSVS